MIRNWACTSKTRRCRHQIHCNCRTNPLRTVMTYFASVTKKYPFVWAHYGLYIDHFPINSSSQPSICSLFSIQHHAASASASMNANQISKSTSRKPSLSSPDPVLSKSTLLTASLTDRECCDLAEPGRLRAGLDRLYGRFRRGKTRYTDQQTINQYVTFNQLPFEVASTWWRPNGHCQCLRLHQTIHMVEGLRLLDYLPRLPPWNFSTPEESRARYPVLSSMTTYVGAVTFYVGWKVSKTWESWRDTVCLRRMKIFGFLRVDEIGN